VVTEKFLMQVVLLQLTLQDLTWWLLFENAKEAAVFWDHFVLRSIIFSTEVVLCTDLLHNLSQHLSLCHAASVTELQWNWL